MKTCAREVVRRGQRGSARVGRFWARRAPGGPEDAETWGSERVLKANRIEWLCTDREAAKLVTRKGVRIKGARIDERLVLSDVDVAFPLTIVRSALPRGIDLQRARQDIPGALVRDGQRHHLGATAAHWYRAD